MHEYSILLQNIAKNSGINFFVLISETKAKVSGIQKQKLNEQKELIIRYTPSTEGWH